MAVQFLDSPPTIVRAGGPRDLAPEIVEFLDSLRENPGKWAEFPGERKTKPLLSDEFEVVGRGGKWYCSVPESAEETEAL